MQEVGNMYVEEDVVPYITENQEYLPTELENLQPVVSLGTNDEGIVLTFRYLVHYKKETRTKTYLHRNNLIKFGDQDTTNFAVLDIRIRSK